LGKKRKIREDPTITAILHLLKKQSYAAKQTDRHRYTALNVAIYKGAPLKVVAALLKAWPGAAKEKK